MKNQQKGFIIPILIGVAALLLVGGGMYVYTQKEVAVTNESGSGSTTTTVAINSDENKVPQKASEKIPAEKAVANTAPSYNSSISKNILDCVLPNNPYPSGDPTHICLEKIQNLSQSEYSYNNSHFPRITIKNAEELQQNVALIKSKYPEEYSKIKTGKYMSEGIIFTARLFAADECLSKSENDAQVVFCLNNYKSAVALTIVQMIAQNP